MTDIILIIVGVLFLGICVYIYNAYSKQEVETASKRESSGEAHNSKSASATQTSNKLEQPRANLKNESFLKVRANNIELQTVIDVAIADGVLTANDRGLIKQTAIGKGFDYVEVLDNVEKRVRFLEIDSNTALVDQYKKNRLDFEVLVKHKFCRVLFRVMEWLGDKYEQGEYAETLQFPDFLIKFIGFEKNIDFAVKCKWRQTTYKRGIAISTTEQLNQYRTYAKENNTPFFIVLGLAGKGTAPERLFIVPIQKIKKPFIHLSHLKKYEKKVGANFYFDYVKKELH